MTISEDKVEFHVGKTTGNKLLVPCIRCAGRTNHVVVQDLQEHGTDAGWGFDFQWIHEYQIVQCLGCDQITFRRERSNSEESDEEGNSILTVDLFPNRVNNWQTLKEAHYLPSALNQIYEETVVALNGAQPILSGIGAGFPVNGPP